VAVDTRYPRHVQMWKFGLLHDPVPMVEYIILSAASGKLNGHLSVQMRFTVCEAQPHELAFRLELALEVHQDPTQA